MAEYGIGIDLGTTNSCMAAVRPTSGGQFREEVLYNAGGQFTTPSVVALTAQGDWLVGAEAKGQAIVNPENTVFSVKRFIGRSFSEPSVVADAAAMPYRLVQGEAGSVKIELRGPGGRKEILAPEQISAKVLKKLKEDAEDVLGSRLTRAVITVPAYFNPNQRNATINAAVIAGFGENVRLISEPTAAALAYGQASTKESETLLVFDLGGGTLDVTIIHHRGNRYMSRTIAGDTHLGGDDFDRAIMDWMKTEFKRETGISIDANPQALQRVRDAAEAAKCELGGSKQQTVINLPFLAAGPDGVPRNLALTLSRALLENMTSHLIGRCIECCKKALADASLTTDKIDLVLLVGGQTKMPAVERAVENFFGKKPARAVNPDQAVALGAAILGHNLVTGGGDAVEGREDEGARFPATAGAPSAGGLRIVEVSSQPLGIRLHTDEFSEIIPKGATLPASRVRDDYSTVHDCQEAANIEVFQGPNRMCVQNARIGEVLLEGIPRMRRGEPRIEVTFAVNLDNTIKVRARELKSGRQVEAVLRYDGAMSRGELDRAIAKERVS